MKLLKENEELEFSYITKKQLFVCWISFHVSDTKPIGYIIIEKIRIKLDGKLVKAEKL